LLNVLSDEQRISDTLSNFSTNQIVWQKKITLNEVCIKTKFTVVAAPVNW
jgi:hypothetical protein